MAGCIKAGSRFWGGWHRNRRRKGETHHFYLNLYRPFQPRCVVNPSPFVGVNVSAILAGFGIAGLRTFPLVAMAACGYMITGMYVLDSSDAEARVLYGIITGIGFIGGGAILKDGGTVSGTATAASIWTTGAIGIAVAFQRYEIAILLCFMTFVTLSLGQHLKDKVRS